METHYLAEGRLNCMASMDHKPGDAPLTIPSFLLLISAYLSLNSSLNLMNKWALGVYGFRFPLLMTSTHMAFSFAILAPLALREGLAAHLRTLQKQWKGVVYIGCFMALNIALNNASLLDVSLSVAVADLLQPLRGGGGGCAAASACGRPPACLPAAAQLSLGQRRPTPAHCSLPLTAAAFLSSSDTPA